MRILSCYLRLWRPPLWAHTHLCFSGMLWADGFGPAQVVMHGLPIRPAFAETRAPQRVLRKRLGMDRHLPAVLLVGAQRYVYAACKKI